MRHTLISLFIALLLAGAVHSSRAQVRIHGGLGAVPGIGLQASYVQINRFVTLEGLLVSGFAPSFLGGESTLSVAMGLGGSIRILDILSEFNRSPFPGYHLDAGVHLGPALRFILGDQTVATKNTRFRLFLEPFVRVSTLVRSRTVYLELGSQRPILRAGIVLPF